MSKADWVAGLLIVVLVVSLVGLATTKVNSSEVTRTSGLATVEFEGHYWIVQRGGQTWAPIHHPDCRCGRAR